MENVTLSAPPATFVSGREAVSARWLVFPAAVLPLVAVLLGGSTAPMSAAVVLVLVGELLLLAPPRVRLGWPLEAALGGLVFLPALTLLPASWFGSIPWREKLLALGIELTGMLHPEPWLGLDAWFHLLAGACFLAWNLAARWDGAERSRLVRWLAGGAVLVAVLSLFFQRTGWQPPGWSLDPRFGPFPNRNQSANFFALAALLVLARAHLDFRRRGGPWAALGWLLGWGALALALFQCLSRAGILLLFGGAAAYLLGVAWLGAARSRHLESDEGPDEHPDDPVRSEAVRILRAEKRRAAPSTAMRREAALRTLGAGGSLLLVLASVFFLFGGATLGRFLPPAATPGAAATPGEATAPAGAAPLDFRVQLQQDALDLGTASAWPGTGLGTVADLLNLYRTRTAGNARALHPESDWVWLRVEAGWPAAACALAALGLILWRCFPLQRGGVEPLRLAGIIAVIAFALHSLADVAGHRLGTALFAAAVAGVAVRRGEGTVAAPSGLVWLWRVAGLVLVGAGAATLFNAGSGSLLPGFQGVANAKAAADSLARGGQLVRATDAAAAGLRFAPLDARLWRRRAEYGLAAQEDFEAVKADFDRARALEPMLAAPVAQEALLWTSTRPAYAASALAEVWRRSREEGLALVPRVFHAAIAAGPAGREFFPFWWDVARRDLRLTTSFLELAPAEDARRALDALLADDPRLTRFALAPAELGRVLRVWARRGDAPALLEAIAREQSWQVAGWQGWAEAAAGGGDLAQASRIASRHVPAPRLPPRLSPNDTMASLERDWNRRPDDVARGYELFQALMRAGRTADAVGVISKLTALPNAPVYLFYLEADARTRAGDAAGAWPVWQRYFELAGLK